MSPCRKNSLTIRDHRGAPFSDEYLAEKKKELAVCDSLLSRPRADPGPLSRLEEVVQGKGRRRLAAETQMLPHNQDHLIVSQRSHGVTTASMANKQPLMDNVPADPIDQFRSGDRRVLCCAQPL